MAILEKIAAWIDIRPNEVRKVTLSFLGAFLVMAFLVLARSLREALYLTSFDVRTLPYVMAAVAVLSVPAVDLFVRLQARYQPRRVLNLVVAVLGAGLVFLVPIAAVTDTAVVFFYLWTAIGATLLTSSFWILTSEHYPVRGAKRLFGLIGAGGTAGAMVMGNSLVWLTHTVDLAWLIGALILLLGLFYLTQRTLPALTEPPEDRGGGEEGTASVRTSVALVWTSAHLRTIAFIVLSVAVATTLLDYQFKELARAAIDTREGLTGFFGAFYGWTGLISLVIQFLVASRFIASAGVAWALAALPLVLMVGSAALVAAPGLVLVTLVRGGDASLRKSIYRSAVEILFVPVPSGLRRKTKTFIDSVVDSAAHGLGAGIVFLWVTLSGLPSRYLSVYVILLTGYLLLLSRRMGRQYFRTVTEGLKEGRQHAELAPGAASLEGRDLISGTFTRLDLASRLSHEGPRAEHGLGGQAESATEEEAGSRAPERPESANLRAAAEALEGTTDWASGHIPALTRLLARDQLFDQVVAALTAAGDVAVPHLMERLRDESTDFVIRRRIPRVLAHTGGPEADRALLDALTANRFEIRYRAAIALIRRRKRDLPQAATDTGPRVWLAVRSEVGRERPVWELQRLLDEPDADDLVARRVGVRGELSLEHTFRLLMLVLEPEAVRAAFHGITLKDDRLRSFALEYLEQVLPGDIRDKLWPVIGDLSDYERRKAQRPIDEVVSDLVTTGATLFADTRERAELKRILEDEES